MNVTAMAIFAAYVVFGIPGYIAFCHMDPSMVGAERDDALGDQVGHYVLFGALFGGLMTVCLIGYVIGRGPVRAFVGWIGQWKPESEKVDAP